MANLRYGSLDTFFLPSRVAVIGATEQEGSVGRTVVANLIAEPFKGAVYAINPRRSTVLGLPCYSAIAQIPAKPDLAVIVTPARTVPSVVAECVDAGVKAAIIISAGFREAGSNGQALEEQIRQEIQRGASLGRPIRIIGPNCLGLMAPASGLNATFANAMAQKGHVGFISQSGALCTAILDWSLQENVGFSAFVSVGSMLDVGWGDLIQYLGDDPATRSIAIYMESVADARSFLSAAREVALSKPIIAIKPGRTEAASKAAASHTGALTGSDEVLDAAFRRCGVLRVNTIAELFYLTEALDKQPRPAGPRLTILTNAGGPGVLATDALLSEGGELSELAPATLEKLDSFLPPHWSRHNPIDIIGDADADRYAKAVEITASDQGTDGLLAILAPTGLADPTEIAKKLAPFAKLPGKPIIASWMGGQSVAAGDAILARAGIPTYHYPDSAARVFQSMWRFSANLKALYETPTAVEETTGDATSRARASALVEQARAKGRTILTEAESKSLLEAYGIPTVPTRVAPDEGAAVRCSHEFGYPVALKLHSETITHKTDVGGVVLNLADEAAVRGGFAAIRDSVNSKAGEGHFLGVTVQPMIRAEGYELIMGSSIDSQFGPVLLFGTGGQLVEVFQDRALALPPLNTTLARRVIERTKIATALRGVRGRKPVDLADLERLLVRFSSLVIEQVWIKEIDINPLLASPENLIALDARVVLFPLEVQVPPRPAIRPYPSQYVKPWRFENGEEVLIRPIRPDDEPGIVRFHATLSERSVFLRYFHLLQLDYRVSHERLVRICFNDYDREIALVALQGGDILAVGRLTKLRHINESEFAVLISDDHQGRGLGTELVRRLIEIARAEKHDRVNAEILPENHMMQNVCRMLGFKLEFQPDEGAIHATLEL
jgi:acetyltransferase